MIYAILNTKNFKTFNIWNVYVTIYHDKVKKYDPVMF